MAEKVGLVMIWLSFGYDLLSNAFFTSKDAVPSL